MPNLKFLIVHIILKCKLYVNPAAIC